MKLKVIIILILVFALNFNLLGQTIKTFSITGGVGRPLGREDYFNGQVPDVALFSNQGMVYNIGFDITLKSMTKWKYGLFVRCNYFSEWKATGISDRFANSSLITIDFGPAFYFQMNRFNSNNNLRRILVVPFVSFMNLTNGSGLYKIEYNISVGNNQTALLSFQKKEDISSLTQIIPGIYVGFEWATFINERAGLIVRPGLTYMFTNSKVYPDKNALIPSLTVGYTIDNTRNKWFFINKD